MQTTRLYQSSIFRLALIYLCLFSGAVIVLVGFIYWNTTQSLTRQIDATIDAEIRGLSEQFDQRGLMGLIIAIERRTTPERESGPLYLLTDRNFAPLVGNLEQWPTLREDGEGWYSFELAEVTEDDSGRGRARVFDLGGWYHLLVGYDVREQIFVAAVFRTTLIWGIAGVVGLSLLGGFLMTRKLLRKVEAINRTSREIMAGDLSQRVPSGGRGDEFDQLADNLNVMLDKIERLLASVRQVSDNIAHDLRSPLTRMRSRLELTLFEQPNKDGYREIIEQTINEADQLLQTFNALLSIAQAEAGAMRESFEKVDLGGLIDDLAELYEALAEARGLSFEAENHKGLEIQGNRDLLFQAVANLVDNALKFTPEGGEVRLSLTQQNGNAVVTVADSGPGIPDAELDKVLERFYRLEASRSTPGSGLGLSLCAAVAELHRGRLDLADNDPGLNASLVLPLS